MRIIVYRFNSTLQDITVQELAILNTESSERFAYDIINNSEAAQTVWLEEDMVFNMVNKKMFMFLGRDRSILGRPFMEAIPELKKTCLWNGYVMYYIPVNFTIKPKSFLSCTGMEYPIPAIIITATKH